MTSGNEDSARLWENLVDEVCALVEGQAQGSRRTLRVSPEVAEMLERIESAGSAAAEPMPEPPEDPQAALDMLEAQVKACTRCPLHETRTNTVFGEGKPGAKLVFVGEAPGYHEDQQGVPFVGKAGQLLTDIIEKGMSLTRNDVYICNVLKCRPPENRDPLPEEVAACEPFLVQQLEVIRPRVICALGGQAAHTLLKTDLPVGQLRGKWHFYHGIPLRVTYHPAYLLRNPGDKRKAWADVIEVMKVYHGEINPTPDHA